MLFDDFKQRFRLSGTLTCTVRVGTQADTSAFREIMSDGALKIDLAAVPENSKANEELVRFLAEEFQVSRSAITIISGQTSRTKVVRVSCPLPQPLFRCGRGAHCKKYIENIPPLPEGGRGWGWGRFTDEIAHEFL